MNREIIVEANMLMDTVIFQLEQGTEVSIIGCGDSMKPFIENGEDKVVLKKIPESKQVCAGEIYLYKRSNGKYAIHRIFDVQEESFSAVGDAQVSVETDIPKKHLVALVSRVIKKDGTEIDCTNPDFVRNSAVHMRRRIRQSIKKQKMKRLSRLPLTAVKKILFMFGKKK